jgi:hypothetical protein
MRDFFFWLAKETSIFTWIVTIVLDLLWNLVDGTSIFSVAGILCYPAVIMIIFSICFPTVALIQHYHSGQEWKPAIRMAAIFSTIAAVPFSVVSLIVGAISAIVSETTDRNLSENFGRLGLYYRELEKTIKISAVVAGMPNGNWREITMESAINILENAGKITTSEAYELHELRKIRNYAHHERTPANLAGWVLLASQLLQKYRNRFGAAWA